MASKTYYFRIIFKILLLATTCWGLAYLTLQKQYDFATYTGFIIVFQIINLINFLNKTNRKIAFFFNAIENNDSTINFPEHTKNKVLKDLYKSMNRVNQLIQNVKVKNETQERYYHTILQHAAIGILTINKKGHIILANKTAKSLLSYESLTHIQQLKRIDENLFKLLSDLTPFDNKLFNLQNEREAKNLTIKTTPIKIEEDDLLLVIIQNISNELSENEVDSWVKMFRVLTHEIMNTIAPITSISQTLSDRYIKDNSMVTVSEINETDIKNTINGLNIIEDQSKNLMKFVESYRTLTKIPAPEKDIINVVTLFNKIRILVSQENGFNDIKFEIKVTPENLEIYADEKQLIQVLINLTKNALQALEGNSNGIIQLIGKKEESGKTTLQIIDNGPGISKELQNQIFIPFFTTKKNGSGIGLSLSRHIIQLHSGQLRVSSAPLKKTIFSLTI
ncbi:sensor histidine kinase [Aestuariibaculum sediminum]|uniref:histidine kinase n=1 Tax=Aestuariibaculum sediminum TaxID=2770637 RepID=A0A8J6Q141_9FLAO|nr:ATP-binding protein [Aestuariibaculum sediminum]MBD0833768.1 histidine kinase [Aestuariibaculum sediminum]